MHPLSRLYRNVTNRTLMRDVKSLKDLGLAKVEGDILRANLELMTQFTALRRPAVSKRQQPP